MKKTALALSLLALVGAVTSVPAFAGPVYTSGATTSNFDAWRISGQSAVTDGFNLTEKADITGATFEIWLYSVDPALTSVKWSLSTCAYGANCTDIASGTADPTATSLRSPNGFSIDSEAFSIPSLVLNSGTYWFTLGGAESTNDDGVFWDQNNGTSIGLDLVDGSISTFDCLNDFGCGKSGGETFSLTGSAITATPEPSSFLLLGTGLAGIAGMIRRKLRA